jgi:hypothetical protein
MVVDKLSRYGVVRVAASLRCRRYDGGWEVGHSSSGTEDIGEWNRVFQGLGDDLHSGRALAGISLELSGVDWFSPMPASIATLGYYAIRIARVAE